MFIILVSYKEKEDKRITRFIKNVNAYWNPNSIELAEHPYAFVNYEDAKNVYDVLVKGDFKLFNIERSNIAILEFVDTTVIRNHQTQTVYPAGYLLDNKEEKRNSEIEKRK